MPKHREPIDRRANVFHRLGNEERPRKGICKEFYKYGTCKYGETCRFPHEPRMSRKDEEHRRERSISSISSRESGERVDTSSHHDRRHSDRPTSTSRKRHRTPEPDGRYDDIQAAPPTKTKHKKSKKKYSSPHEEVADADALSKRGPQTPPPPPEVEADWPVKLPKKKKSKKHNKGPKTPPQEEPDVFVDVKVHKKKKKKKAKLGSPLLDEKPVDVARDYQMTIRGRTESRGRTPPPPPTSSSRERRTDERRHDRRESRERSFSKSPERFSPRHRSDMSPRGRREASPRHRAEFRRREEHSPRVRDPSPRVREPSPHRREEHLSNRGEPRRRCDLSPRHDEGLSPRRRGEPSPRRRGEPSPRRRGEPSPRRDQRRDDGRGRGHVKEHRESRQYRHDSRDTQRDDRPRFSSDRTPPHSSERPPDARERPPEGRERLSHVGERSPYARDRSPVHSQTWEDERRWSEHRRDDRFLDAEHEHTRKEKRHRSPSAGSRGEKRADSRGHRSPPPRARGEGHRASSPRPRGHSPYERRLRSRERDAPRAMSPQPTSSQMGHGSPPRSEQKEINERLAAIASQGRRYEESRSQYPDSAAPVSSSYHAEQDRQGDALSSQYAWLQQNSALAAAIQQGAAAEDSETTRQRYLQMQQMLYLMQQQRSMPQALAAGYRDDPRYADLMRFAKDRGLEYKNYERRSDYVDRDVREGGREGGRRDDSRYADAWNRDGAGRDDVVSSSSELRSGRGGDRHWRARGQMRDERRKRGRDDERSLSGAKRRRLGDSRGDDDRRPPRARRRETRARREGEDSEADSRKPRRDRQVQDSEKRGRRSASHERKRRPSGSAAEDDGRNDDRGSDRQDSVRALEYDSFTSSDEEFLTRDLSEEREVKLPKCEIVDALGIDWSKLKQIGKAKQSNQFSSVREQFTPAKLFTSIGVSPTLLGERLTKEVCKVIGDSATKEIVAPDTPALLTSAAFERNRLRRSALTDIGPFRRGLCARRDLTLRARLCNLGKPPSEVTTASVSHDHDLLKLSIQMLRGGASSVPSSTANATSSAEPDVVPVANLVQAVG